MVHEGVIWNRHDGAVGASIQRKKTVQMISHLGEWKWLGVAGGFIVFW